MQCTPIENLISWSTFSLNAPIRISRREWPYLYNNWLNSGSGYPWRTVASNQPNFGFLSFNAGQHWNYFVIVMDRNVARSLFRSRSRNRSRHNTTRPSIPLISVLRALFFSPFPFLVRHYRTRCEFDFLDIWLRSLIASRRSHVAFCDAPHVESLCGRITVKRWSTFSFMYGWNLSKNISHFSHFFSSYKIYWFYALIMKIIIIIIIIL